MKHPSLSAIFCAGFLLACGGGDNDDTPGDASGPGDSAPGVDGAPTGTPNDRVAAYIRSDVHTKLVFEIDSVPGSEPRASVETDLVERFTELLDKPGGITTVRDGDIASRGADHAWTFDELRALASAQKDLILAGDTTRIHVLYVDGHSADDSDQGKILGLAWSNENIAIFKETIESTCRGGLVLPALEEELCRRAELGILTHEVGHVIGLVANGLPMVVDHRDDEHGAHDESDDCIMYWAYQRAGLVDVIAGRLTGGDTSELAFDSACLADIAAVRR